MNVVPSQPSQTKTLRGADVADLVRASTPDVRNLQRRPTFSRVAIVGEGKPHTVVGQLCTESKVVQFSPAVDPTATDADLRVSDAFVDSDPTLSEGEYVVDISEMPDRAIGVFIGEAQAPAGDDGQLKSGYPMYAVHRQGRTFKISSATAILGGTRVWVYQAYQCRLKANPASAGSYAVFNDMWENVPDADLQVLYNRAEWGNTASKVYRGDVNIDSQLTDIKPIPVGAIVFATPHSFPKHGATAASVCWTFEAMNAAVIGCP